MTGYATLQHETPHGTLQVELRSVNARFLDLSFKIPDDLRLAEPVLRERLAGLLKRGKLECRVAFHRPASTERRTSVDRDVLASVAQAAAVVQQIVPDASPMTVADLLRWPGVLGDDRFDPAALAAHIAPLADEVLVDFVASRRREGRKLAEVILGQIEQIEQTVDSLADFVPSLLRQYEEKLTERLRAVLVDATQGTPVPAEETFSRLRQEITLYGMRIDVAEELARLRAHAQEVRDVLTRGGPVGKRLDFLMQEMNREANTVGSKAAARELTAAAMSLKLMIEQIREQVQNLE